MNSEFKDAMDCAKIDGCIETLQYIKEKLLCKGISKRSATYESMVSIISQLQTLKEVLSP